MGDLATLAKAKMELEQLYLGIPDDSVNLTFQDLATVKQQVPTPASSGGDRILIPLVPISGSHHPLKLEEDPVMRKLPSLDFTKGLAESSPLHPYHDLNDCVPEHPQIPTESYRRGSGSKGLFSGSRLNSPSNIHNANYHDTSAISANMSMSMSMMSTASGYRHHEGRVGARRPGIPHSNICTVCTTYVYVFRHRCLVCGRLYCRSCVGMGMGDMTEGRKCLECLGRRFSARYIQRAGKVGCCARYPSSVKQAELKWAEKGARRTGERGNGRGGSRTPPSAPRTPTLRAPPFNPPSFVMTSSPYSPANPHLPF